MSTNIINAQYDWLGEGKNSNTFIFSFSIRELFAKNFITKEKQRNCGIVTYFGKMVYNLP